MTWYYRHWQLFQELLAIHCTPGPAYVLRLSAEVLSCHGAYGNSPTQTRNGAQDH